MKKQRSNFVFKLRATPVFVAACAALFFIVVSASAQNANSESIAGRVLDPNNSAVAGARVTLYERNSPRRVTTMSDDKGAYRFANLTAGEYLIEAQASGFAPFASEKTINIERGRETDFDIKLEPAGVQAEVVVTAADAPQSIDEVSKDETTLTRSEIEARSEISIPDALRVVPGLRVQQLGGAGTLTSIKTRGLRNQDTAVLIDGFRLRDAASPQGDATAFLSDLIVTDLNRVEVLRGSGSSLYGTNAIGGVINIITDEGGGRLRGDLLAEGGSFGTLRGRANLAGSAREDKLTYSFGITHLNVARGLDGQDAARNTSGQGRAAFRLAPSATLSARIYAADTFVQTNSSPQTVGSIAANGIINAVPLSLNELRRFENGTPISQLNIGSATFIPNANDPDASQAQRFFSGAFAFAQTLSDAFNYSIAYHALTSRRVSRDGPAGVGFQPATSNRADYDGAINTLNARADFRLGRFNYVTAGYEFENENFFNRSLPNILQPASANNSSVDVTQRSHALFARNLLRLLDERLQLSAAFRAQFFNLRAPQFNPSGKIPYMGNFTAPPNAYTGDGSIAYLFRERGAKVRAHVGNGYRAPSLYERFGTSFFFGSFSAYGDPRLRPERSISVDGGIDQTFAHNRARASATYFYTRLQETIVFGNVPQPDPFGRAFGGYRNAGGGLARGAELSLSLAPTRTLDLFASYTYTNSLQRTPQISGTNFLRSLVIPTHQFAFVATQNVMRRVLLNFTLTAQSSYIAPIFDNTSFVARAYRFGKQARADLNASYTLPLDEARAVRFFVTVENLFDAAIYESGFRTPGINARAGAAFSF
jgi:vitamin B12 transporter